MKKFQFSLQRLYDVKEMEEQQKQAQLRDLERNLENYKRQKEANRKLYDREHAVYDKKCRTGMSMFEVQRYGDYFQYRAKEMRQPERVIQSMQATIETCRAGLLQIINEKNVLDRKREDQYEEYKKEVAKDENKTIEDFMQSRM